MAVAFWDEVEIKLNLELESVLKYFWKRWRVVSASVVLATLQMAAYSEVGALTPEAGVALSSTKLEALELELFNVSQRLLLDPTNPQLLLQKGIYLSDLGRLQAAFDVFESLRVAFPDHPVPYNNLASIYARWGRLEDARQMLLKSRALEANQVQTHLSIASVNIGLALDALSQARALKPTDSATQKKIRLLESYLTESSKINATSLAQEGPGADSKPNATGVLQDDKSKSASKASRKKSQRASKGAQDRLKLDTFDDVWTDSANTQKTAASTQAANPQQAGVAMIATDVRHAELREVLESWSKSWSQQDFGSYQGYYSDKFQPSDGTTRSVWAERKKLLMTQAKYIRVTLKITEIQVTGDHAIVLLDQKYKSDRYADHQRKELRMQLEAGQWKILSEK